MTEKISHLKDDGMLLDDKKRRSETTLPDGRGRIVSYRPFESMQIIFFDVNYPALSEPPDLWQLGYRKSDAGRYLRTLICKRGSCVFTVNGKSNTLSAGQVMMDYGVGDKGTFTFSTEDFSGVEITMQIDSLTKESSLLKMLRLAIEAMHLPEEEIFDSDGYVFSYSKTSEQTLTKLLSAGLDGSEGIIMIVLVVEIGHNLGTDLKDRCSGEQLSSYKKQLLIAEDIYHCLTEDFGQKNTATKFAEKYGVSDTTVKKYFKNVYGYGFKEYQTKVRMEWAADKLITTGMKVGEISDAVGYSKHTKFCKAFKKYYDVTPLVYRRTYKVKNAKSKEDKGE